MSLSTVGAQHGPAAAGDAGSVGATPTPSVGLPVTGPDTAPLPPGTTGPAYDAIRARCAIAVDRRSCIEAAQRDEVPPRSPADTAP